MCSARFSRAISPGSRSRYAGHVLFESLLCIALISLGVMPLAVLGSQWLRWSGDHEQLTATLQLAAERAEAGADTWPLVGGDPQRVALCDAPTVGAGCTPGHRVAVAGLSPDTTTEIDAGEQPLAGIALWVSP